MNLCILRKYLRIFLITFTALFTLRLRFITLCIIRLITYIRQQILSCQFFDIVRSCRIARQALGFPENTLINNHYICELGKGWIRRLAISIIRRLSIPNAPIYRTTKRPFWNNSTMCKWYLLKIVISTFYGTFVHKN